MAARFASLGFGLGLRSEHFEAILKDKPAVDWFEVLTEDYLVKGGRSLYYLDQIRECYPLVMHGVSMSLGSSDPLDWDYLNQVKALSQRIGAHWISDHCCWTGVDQVNLHDLMPLPYTEEAIAHIVQRIRQVQDFLEQPLVIENVSSYITYTDSAMTEWDFLNAICREADCLLLLDVNNVYVSGFNHKFDPKAYLDAIDPTCVQQFHLAGHHNFGTHIVDTHDTEIIQDVWDLYAYAVKRFEKVSTLIERDDNIPKLNVLLAELDQARQVHQSALHANEVIDDIAC